MVLGATGGAMPLSAESSLWLLEPLVRWAKLELGPGACDPPGRFVQASIGIGSPTLSCCRDTWDVRACAGINWLAAALPKQTGRLAARPAPTTRKK